MGPSTGDTGVSGIQRNDSLSESDVEIKFTSVNNERGLYVLDGKLNKPQQKVK